MARVNVDKVLSDPTCSTLLDDLVAAKKKKDHAQVKIRYQLLLDRAVEVGLARALPANPLPANWLPQPEPENHDGLFEPETDPDLDGEDPQEEAEAPAPRRGQAGPLRQARTRKQLPKAEYDRVGKAVDKQSAASIQRELAEGAKPIHDKEKVWAQFLKDMRAALNQGKKRVLMPVLLNHGELAGRFVGAFRAVPEFSVGGMTPDRKHHTINLG